MKLSKSLLQSIAVGVALGSFTACESLDTTSDVKPEICAEECTEDGCTHNKQHLGYDCPACGMG